MFDDEIGPKTDEECGDWDYCDSERCDAPEFLFCVSGEWKVPTSTVNGTENGAKGKQEQGVEVMGISMLWDVERRDVCGVNGEGN